VNDSPNLEVLFQELVEKDPELSGTACSLVRHVVTCWNSYLLSIESHIHFKGPVQWLTGHERLKLKKYALTDSQWVLAHQLYEVLEVIPQTFFCSVHIHTDLISVDIQGAY
jgi:hypothetical protein